MDITNDNMRALANYLQQTMNPDSAIRRPAERFLEGIEVNQNYGLLLLNLIDKPEVDATIRVAAAIAFKNFIKRNWPVDEDGTNKIHDSDRTAIKNLIVNLMLKSPEAVQKQFSDAVSIIGKYDFPEKWPSLIPEMVEKFATGDFHLINGVLRTAHSLFKKYRYEFKSQKLWEEIKHVLENFAKPITDLFIATLELAKTHANNKDALKVIYGSLVLICKVFYSLNCQDLPEFFEDNMSVWMPNFLSLLSTRVELLESKPDEESPSVMEYLRSEVCECVSLYALKYDEEFAPHASIFVTAVWTVLLSTGPQAKFDNLVSNALSFLAKIANKHNYKNLFEDPATLSSICEKVVIPNMEFRESDMELFEDNPEEYVRRDIEGSDVDTRRHAACELVKTLALHFEEKIMSIYGQYVQLMLARYGTEGASAWRGKDTAMFLVSSLVSRGATHAAGVTKVSPLVDLSGFATEHVIPELQRENVNELPVLKADAIKYLMIFRTVLPHELLHSALPYVIKHLGSNHSVVCTYAACCIEKLIGSGIVTREVLEPHAAQLLTSLFAVLAPPNAPLELNEYVMKAILRTLACLQQSALQYVGAALPQLAQMLAIVAKNPSKPHFNHFIFETLSLAVTLVTKANPSAIGAFEDALFPIFQDILQNDIQEFMPYVFQMLSLLLELRGSGADPSASADTYGALLPCLVAPALWERTANVRPLVRLLCAYIAVRPEQVLQARKVDAMLGIFQKLVASKLNDHEGFYLLQSMLFKYGESVMQPYIKQIMVLLFQRLSSSKTTKYVKGLIAFFGFYSTHFGPDNLIDIVDSIQANMFGMYVDRVLLPDLQKVSGNVERKAAASGCVRMLAHSKHFKEGCLKEYWPKVMQALISLFELPTDETSLPDDHFIEVDDTPGYEAAYSQLVCAKNHTDNPMQGIADPRSYLAQCLKEMSVNEAVILTAQLAKLEPAHRAALDKYLNQYSVNIG